MAAAPSLPPEEHFLCPICLELLAQPVSTPCGHNFCQRCLLTHWTTAARCRCPLCKQDFVARPELKVNTFISHMVDSFRQEVARSGRRSAQQLAQPGDVPCDVCTGARMKAVKSCLECQTSYCPAHLEPHLAASGLRRHQLIPPVENLQERMCPTHHKPLELFCRTDQVCVCSHCPALDHQHHQVAPVKEASREKKEELEAAGVRLQQLEQSRRAKIQEVKQKMELSKQRAQREVAGGGAALLSLREAVERSLAQLVSGVQRRQRALEQEAQGLLSDLDQELLELHSRRLEAQQLSRSEDHVQVLQRFQTAAAPPASRDWTQVSVPQESYQGTLRSALLQLQEQLQEQLRRLLVEEELKERRSHAVDVTLDPDTAHPELLLSPDGRQVRQDGRRRRLDHGPRRFSHYNFVLGLQSFSSGCCYFEVEVGGKPRWMVGVATGSVERKRPLQVRPDQGFWTLWLRDGDQYWALAAPPVRLQLQAPPHKLGVFLDLQERLLSFYDVQASALIYSFRGCSFNQELHPFFSPGRNDDGSNATPLNICVVST